MSDPVSKVDIEDVLSSIRRLVSYENGPRQVDFGLKPSDQNAPLLLTSAQRVCLSDTARHGTEGAKGAPQSAFASSASAVTGGDHIGGSAAGGVRSPGHPAPFSIDGTVPLNAPASQPMPDDFQGMDGARLGQESPLETGSVPVPQARKMVVAPPGPPIGADTAGNHGDDKVSCDWAQTVSDQGISHGDASEANACPAPEYGPDCQLSANLPEPERLRELVAEIVREELNGVLGDRITQNVRKLVRREIHRVLTIQDLDPT